MATAVKEGPIVTSLNQDDNGDRDYHVSYLVRGQRGDGPGAVLLTPGLPVPGTSWNFFGDCDSVTDIWATRKLSVGIKAAPEYKDGEWPEYWTVDFVFSTRREVGRRSEDRADPSKQVGDPLFEPPKISGSFTKYTEEAFRDRLGRPVLNSAHEQMRGPQVEFDANRPQIRIEQNVLNLELALFSRMIDTLNKYPLWGLPRRCIKLSDVSWERKFYGHGIKYYTRNLTFDIRTKPATGVNSKGKKIDTVMGDWDRDLLDEGTKMLKGHWNNVTGNYVLDNIDGQPPDPKNPAHFIRAKDPQAENYRVILNGAGLPAEAIVGTDQRYISLDNGNTGHRVDDDNFWLPLNSNPNEVDDWNPLATWLPGELVVSEGLLFIASVINTGIQPGGGVGEWHFLGDKTAFNPNFAGVYNAGTTYAIGEYVKDTTQTGIGSIHLEKYSESNLLLLGIPTIL